VLALLPAPERSVKPSARYCFGPHPARPQRRAKEANASSTSAFRLVLAFALCFYALAKLLKTQHHPRLSFHSI
jgi:hypothetical protein